MESQVSALKLSFNAINEMLQMNRPDPLQAARAYNGVLIMWHMASVKAGSGHLQYIILTDWALRVDGNSTTTLL